MKYLVTGLSGSLGMHIYAALHKEHEIVGWLHEDPIMPDGEFDAVIHLAGKEILAPLGLASPERFDMSFRSVTMLMQILARASIGKVREDGSIIAMSSVAAVCGVPGMSLYSAAKGATEAMVRSAAIELAPKKIRVNAIRAGGFSGAMNDRIAAKIGAAGAEKYAAKHPLGMGEPQHIVQAIRFLLENDWSTGSILTVDGAYSAQ